MAIGIDLERLLPRISDTERVALEAGTVWIEGEIFSGRPDFARMLALPYPSLTDAERAFLEGPVEEACAMVDDWQVHQERELPERVWAFLRRSGFFGLAIPQQYGGLEFSALACSTIYGKLASRSLALSAIVLIPNSVGAGKLLATYGTPAQKERWLPRLARGEEMPCFALTEPTAGSDAASITSHGTAFRAPDGRIGLRLSWNKRYITLAPVATLLGLAFRLRDPENLLGRGREPGITCALVPTSLPGVEIGRRHDPMGVPFPNGPTRGHDVVVPADAIIGGPDGAGLGWKMLMEALSGGRAVSLPAQSAAGARWVARVVGAYSVLREQFGLPIGRFEGVHEPLARIAGLAYTMEAARVYTCGAVDAGESPSVVSAIMKYQQTELARRVLIDGMDVMGGAALCRGPRNLLAGGIGGALIGITVEGANILTRTLIIFGQGAIRAHPYARTEIQALAARDLRGLVAALAGHALFLATGAVRVLLFELTRGRLAHSPVGGEVAPCYRRLAWAAARFALDADLVMIGLGSRLKARERQSGRLADMLSWILLAFAALRRYEAEGRRREDLPLVRWAVEHGLDQAQVALEGVLANFEAPLVGPVVRWLGPWLARLNPLARPPPDSLGSEVAALIQRPGEQRDRLTAGLFLSRSRAGSIARLEEAFELVCRTRPLVERVQAAARAGTLERGRVVDLIRPAEVAGVLTAEEAGELARAEAARLDVLQVDDFDPGELSGRVGPASRRLAG
jgi:acyl-CoA dehydrogenase